MPKGKAGNIIGDIIQGVAGGYAHGAGGVLSGYGRRANTLGTLGDVTLKPYTVGS